MFRLRGLRSVLQSILGNFTSCIVSYTHMVMVGEHGMQGRSGDFLRGSKQQVQAYTLTSQALSCSLFISRKASQEYFQNGPGLKTLVR